MNKYIPSELKDLTESKQRVMNNVVNEIESDSRESNLKWRYVLITAVLSICAMLFVFNEIINENEQQSATEIVNENVQQPDTEIHLDFTQPTFIEEQGLFYLHGVTLGVSQSEVIEHLGENYTIGDYVDGSGADNILDYDGNPICYFYQDKLFSISFKVDENYFDKLFKDYDGVKFISNDNRYIYSKETSHIIKAEYDPNRNLYLSLRYAGPDLLENEGFLKLEQNLD
jgi:hypothetical protein